MKNEICGLGSERKRIEEKQDTWRDLTLEDALAVLEWYGYCMDNQGNARKLLQKQEYDIFKKKTQNTWTMSRKKGGWNIMVGKLMEDRKLKEDSMENEWGINFCNWMEEYGGEQIPLEPQAKHFSICHQYSCIEFSTKEITTCKMGFGRALCRIIVLSNFSLRINIILISTELTPNFYVTKEYWPKLY